MHDWPTNKTKVLVDASCPSPPLFHPRACSYLIAFGSAQDAALAALEVQEGLLLADWWVNCCPWFCSAWCSAAHGSALFCYALL